MPVLPVSEFWRRSFFKYYKLKWAIESDLEKGRKLTMESVNAYSEDDSLIPCWIEYNVPLIIIASLFINFCVLLIPLSEDQHGIDSNLYVTYQSVYTILSYPCTVQIYEVALPNTLTNRFHRYILLPIPVYLIIIALYILYSPIVPGISTSKGTAYSRTLGPNILSVYAIIIFSIIIYGKHCCKYFKNDDCKPHLNPPMYEEALNNELDTATAPASDYGNSLNPITSIQFSKSQDTYLHNSTINSLLLFHNSDTSEEESLCGEQMNVFVSNDRSQIIAAALSTAGIAATYYWTQWLTWQWTESLSVSPSQQATNTSLSAIMLLYPVFWIVINFIKFVVSRFARYCDSNKNSRYSLELIVSFFLTCFYYVYYRNLFLHITSYTSFILIKVSHIFLELTLYLFRMSPSYFEKTDVLQNEFKDGRICCNACCGLLQPLVSLMYDPAPYHIWCVRVSIDYMMQFIVSIGSALGYIGGVLWLRYGYNQSFYNIQNIPKEQFDKTLIFTTIAVVVEFIVYLVIHYIMKHVYHIHVIKHWNALMRHRKGYIWYFMFMLQHCLTDVTIAKLISS